jgi:hypothetical protein
MKIPNLRFMVLVSVHDIELLCLDVFVPELTLNMKENERPTSDWYTDSFREEDLRWLLPEQLELYDEPILFECMGIYSVTGEYDYYGEYDEETDFEIIDWAAEVYKEGDEKELYCV